MKSKKLFKGGVKMKSKKLFKVYFFLLVIFILSINSMVALGSTKELRTNWAWPTYIDPAVGSDNSSCAAIASLYDTLVFPNSSGNVLPHVAESWEVSSDNLTWIFHLRPGTKFHHGGELTADDVKFSMDRLLTIGEGFSSLFTGKINNTEVIDKYTVAFKLNTPFGPFLYTLVRLYIVSKEEVLSNIAEGPYDEMGDYGKKYLLTDDAGSGPYTVSEFPLSEYLIMVKYPDYWSQVDEDAPDVFKMIGTREAITVKTLMKRRELEITDPWQAVEVVQELTKIEGIEVSSYFTGSGFYYMMNTKKAPTDDVHFRKALAWAMDYESVINHIAIGSVQSKGPIPQIIPGHDPTVMQYHKDIDKAIAELKQSKYYGQLDKYPIELHYGAGNSINEKTALLFASNLAEIGVKVNLTALPWLARIKEMSTVETSPNVATIFVSPNYTEAGSMLALRYHSQSAAGWEQNEWLLDPEIDAMIEDATEIVDESERFIAYSKIQHFIVEELCPTIFLYDEAMMRCYQEGYIDWPAAKGNVIPVLGYDISPREIKVYPEKRLELLK